MSFARSCLSKLLHPVHHPLLEERVCAKRGGELARRVVEADVHLDVRHDDERGPVVREDGFAERKTCEDRYRHGRLSRGRISGGDPTAVAGSAPPQGDATCIVAVTTMKMLAPQRGAQLSADPMSRHQLPRGYDPPARIRRTSAGRFWITITRAAGLLRTITNVFPSGETS